MNMRTSKWADRNGFTLVELMIATVLTILLGGIAYIILNTGLVLFSKNTSMNVAHQEARMAMIQMEKQLHLAVSTTQLIDEDGNPVGGKGPAAGISFLVFAGGPFEVAAKANWKQNQVTMNLTDGFQAKAGQRLVIANHELEIDIASDTPGSGIQTLTLAENIPNTINTEMDDAGTMVPAHVVGLIMERVSYRIKDGELRYVSRSGETSVLAREITSPQPFTRPTTGGGNPNSRAIAAINLSTGKGGGKKKKYKSANMILNAEVPARAILCTKP
jgi:prepilin-type N-terminal cleavage/methylation domain-containing protein